VILHCKGAGIVSLASVLKSRRLKVSVFDCQLRNEYVKPLLEMAGEDKTIGLIFSESKKRTYMGAETRGHFF